MKDFLFTPLIKKQLLLGGIDSLLVYTSIFLSFLFKIYFFDTGEIAAIVNILSFNTFLVVVIHILSFYIFELYKIEERFHKVKGIIIIAISTLSVGVLIAMIFYFIPNIKIGRMVLSIHIPFVIVLIFLWRIIFFKKLYILTILIISCLLV